MIKITPAIIAGLKANNPFPEFAIGGETAGHHDHWVAHLREPIFLARVVSDDFMLRIQMVPFDTRQLMSVCDLNSSSLVAYLDIPGANTVVEAMTEPVPEYLYLQDDMSGHPDVWIGIVHTRAPRFIAQSNGLYTIVLDPCDDVAPHLERARDWYAHMINK